MREPTRKLKRILIFSLAYFPDHVGGAEIAIKEITSRISSKDIEFHLITLRFDTALRKQSREGNVFIHRVGWGRRGASVGKTFTPFFFFSKILFILCAALRARQLHRVHPFDGYWAMMTYMLFPIVLLRLVGIRAPYALTLQEGDPLKRVFQRRRIAFFSPLLSVGFKNATVVQTISTFLAKWARQRGFHGPLEVIPNGVAIKHFSQTISSDVLIRTKRELGKKVGDVFLVTTSRLVYKNAVDDVINALSLLPEHIHFVIFGTGPEEMKLRKLSEEKGVLKRTHFRRQISHNDMPRYLKACDIFIRPSRSEGMGNSFVEAFAAGIPVIATQEGGIVDFLFDAKRNPDKQPTGFAVDTDSPQQIAQAVTDTIEHPDMVRGVCANALQLAKEKYDWDLITCGMKMKVFDRL